MSGRRRKSFGFAVALAATLTLTACSSTKLAETGGNSAIAGPAVARADARFAFDSVSGPPREVLASLSSALNEEASAKKLPVVARGDPAATYTIKGYLSAVGDGSNVVLVYVWDVMDKRGARVHRIQGQEVARASGSDPWAGVGNKTLNIVARRSIDELSKWVAAG
jgi:hypothetical protein